MVDEIDEGIVYKDDLVEVEAFKVNHGSRKMHLAINSPPQIKQ